MTTEEISGTAVWRNLTPNVKRILSLFFSDPEHSLVDAVASYHPNLLPDVHKAVAQNLMANPDVQRIISLFFGRRI
jgi:hypothetical protein